MDLTLLNQVLDLAVENVARGGGPFAALVAGNGKVLATGVNQVTGTHDPTAHAEIVAIRAACRALGSFQLTGCDFYTSCEPCPMCLGALFWARPAHVFFAATQQDASATGFDDSFIYQQIALPPAVRAIPMIHVEHALARQPFAAWQAKADRTDY